MTRNLTSGPPARLILAFTVPLLIGNVFQQLYGFADAFVVGRMLGLDALAAVGATGGLTFLLIGFSWGLTNGFAIPVARAFGAGEADGVRRAVAAGAWASLGCAIVLTAAAVPASRVMLTALATPPELLDDATTFAAVTFAATGITVAFNYLAGIIRALGDARTPLVFLVLACVLNVVLVLAFVGWFGLGIAGAALATGCAQLVSVLLCLGLVARRIPALHLTRADWAVRPAELRASLRMGLPMGFQMSIIAIGALVLQYAINGLGAQAVAAFTAAMRVDQVAVAPLSSFGLALATFTAQNRGARQWGRILQGTRQTCLMAVAFAVLVGAVTILAGPALVRGFVGPGEEDVVAMGHTYFLVNGGLYVALALLFVLRNTLQGLGLAGVPTVAGAMELVFRAGAGLLLVGPLGFVGVALAAPLAWLGALIPVAWSWRRQRRWLHEEDARQRLAAVPAPRDPRHEQSWDDHAGQPCSVPT